MMYMDILDGGPAPRRGDRIRSARTTYYVLTSRMVKRRDPNAHPRCMMRVLRVEDCPSELSGALIRSAIRGRGASLLFHFRWYPRGKKRKSFEEYLRH